MTRGTFITLTGILLILLSGIHAQCLTFMDTGQDLDASDSTSIFLADLDGDGDLDMIEGVFDLGSDSGKLWVNNGSGTFTDSGVAFGSPLDTRCGAVFAADLNNDGNLDVVDANQDSLEIRIFTNNGAGVFTDSAQALGALDSRSIYMADLDSDGDIDMIEGVGPDNTNSNIIWMNDGDAGFSDSTQTLGSDDTYSVFGTDVDGDGDIDFISGNYGSDNNIWLNDGKGIFSDAGELLGGVANTNSVFATDVNGDGAPDIIEGLDGADSRIWSNNGTGSYTEIAQTLGVSDTKSVFAIDFDSDGYVDFVEANYDEANMIYLNDGAGTFSDSGVYMGASSSVSIFAGMINGDIAPDIAVGNMSQGNKIWSNTTVPFANTLPDPPTVSPEPDAFTSSATSAITLEWIAGSDTETADADLLTYDLRVGTSSGGCEVYCGYFPASGLSPWMSSLPGNVGSTSSHLLALDATATYYWSVRTVDPTYATSTWDAEDSFTLTFDNTPPSAPATVNDGPVAPDSDYATSTTIISANWSASTDATSSIMGYWVGAGTTPGATDTLTWTYVGNVTATSVSGVSLSGGVTYYMTVKAENNAGLESAATNSNGQMLDTSTPTAVISINDGLGSDLTYSSSTTQLSFNWSASTDSESGIATYILGIGTTAGATDTQTWTEVGNVTFTTFAGLALVDGSTYYATVYAENGVELTGTATNTNGITIDATPPEAIDTLNDGAGADIDYASSSTQLSANWSSATDPVSGIAGYYIGIGTSAGATDTLGWTDTGALTSTTVAGLTLVDGLTYYMTAKAENGAGGMSAQTNSDGVLLDSSGPTAACSINDGTGSDIDYASSTLMIYANWCDFSDPESGVLSYYYAVGTTAGATDTLGWNNIGTATSATISDIALATGTAYYVTVTADNNAGVMSTAYNSDGLVIDTSAPTAPGTVNDGPAADMMYSSSTIQITANWTAATDTESGIVTYMVAVGSTAGANDVANWSDAGNVSSITVTDVMLVTGNTYYVTVKAVNGVGITGTAATSDGVIIEPTPPLEVTTVNDGPASDMDFWWSLTQLSANWSASSDPESGIAGYWIAIGRTPGAADAYGWTGNITETATTVIDLDLSDGQLYYVSVKAENNAGGFSTATSSDGFLIESTPPSDIATVNDGTGDDIDFSTSSQLSANWSASTDAESGLAGYWIAVGTTAGGTEVADWMSNATQTATTVVSIAGTDGTTYYISVKAENGAGNESSVTTSDGLLVDTTPPSAVATVYDGETTTDEDYTSLKTQLTANWSAAVETGSTLTSYWIAIGTTEGATDEVPWTNTATDTIATTVVNLNLTEGNSYYFSVKAENSVGLISDPTSSDGIIPDTTAPSRPSYVYDGDGTTDADSWSQTNKLSASWALSSDSRSGIKTYYYAIGTAKEATDVADWSNWLVNVGDESVTVTRTGISLSDGVTYYFSVKAENGAGLMSTIRSSDGITVKTTDPTSHVSNPTDGQILNLDTIFTTITGTATSGTGETIEVQLWIRKDNNTYWNGYEWKTSEYWLDAKGAESWSYSTLLPTWDTDTTYNIRSMASDAIGNAEIASGGATFTYDITRPVIYSFGPYGDWVPDSDGKYMTNSSNFDVYGFTEASTTATIDGVDVDATELQFLDPVIEGDEIVSYTIVYQNRFGKTIKLSEGETTIEFDVMDRAGNTAHDSTTVILDSTAPTATITIPAAKSTYSGRIDVTGSAQDIHLDYYKLEYGPGSSPSEWKTFQTSGTQIDSRVLGTLDTSRLSGDYSIRLTVVDTFGNSSSTSVSFKVSNTTSANIFVSQNTWIMSAIPLDPDETTINKLFNSTLYTLYWWNPDAAYDDVYGRYVRPTTLYPGQGLWIIPLRSQEETIVLSGDSVDSTSGYEYQIGSGWNQVGTPFNWSFTWSKINVKSGDTTYSLDSAVSAGLVESTPFHYTGTGWRQLSEMSPPMMETGTGYFLYASNTVTLVYDPGSESGSGIAKIVRKDPDVRLKISARTANADDLDNIAALIEDSTDLHDGLDLREPPPGFGKYVSLYFPHTDWGSFAGNYTNDFKQPQGLDSGCAAASDFRYCKLWDFSVETNDTGETVNLSWESLSELEELFEILLTDLSNGTSIDMTGTSDYAFTAVGDSYQRDFQLSVARRASVRTTVSRRLGGGWNLVSIPVDPEITDVITQLGDNLDIDSIYQLYDGTFNTESDREGVDIQAGLGYWIYVPADTTIDVDGFKTDPSVPVQVPLVRGWNLIGNPFDSPITWGDNISLACGDTTISLTGAISGDFIEPKIFSYSDSSYSAVQAGDTLEPWKGYFLYSSRECSLEIKQ